MADFNPYDHFGFLINRVGRLIDLSITPKLKKQGYNFPISCIGVLADLWQKDGITQKELGSSLIKNKSSVTKMLASLENAGLIIKKEDPDDKRNKLIFLTDLGRALREQIESVRPEMEGKLLGEIPINEIEIAKKVLKTFYLNLSDKLFNKK